MWTRPASADVIVTRESFDHHERRSYTLVRPRTVREGAPLVLALHGFRDSGDALRRYSGGSFDSFDAAIAYPDGLAGEWNSARKAVMLSRRAKSVDDVGFLRALAAHLVTSWSLDPGRVYVVGFSLGGQMAIRLICDAPGLLAGAALISSTLPAPGNRVCSDRPPVPVPVLTFHGTADQLAPWRGGTVGLRVTRGGERVFFGKGPHLSVPETLRWFAARNGIEQPPAFEWIRTGGGWVGRTDYRQSGCPPVRGYTVVGGRHEIPGPRWRRWLPDTSARHGFVAAEVISQFFGIHR